MFILDLIDRELHTLKHLELKLRIFRILRQKNPLESFLMCSFVYLGFLRRLFMP